MAERTKKAKRTLTPVFLLSAVVGALSIAAVANDGLAQQDDYYHPDLRAHACKVLGCHSDAEICCLPGN
jgi:hypothetical protein